MPSSSLFFSFGSSASSNQTSPSSARPDLQRRPSQASVRTVATTGTATGLVGAAGLTENHPDLPAIITSRDVADTISAYNSLLSAASTYREALITVSSAAADFGTALENAARCKGAGNSAEPLLNAGGLHYLVSNHQQILARSIQTTFEIPVGKQVHAFKTKMADADAQFRSELADKSRQLRKQEKDHAQMSKLRLRNLAVYRSSLHELSSLVDEIDHMKYDHFVNQFELAQKTSNNILAYAAAVVRAEVEIYEGIARKGWSGGGLDDLISAGPDPFAPSEDEFDEDGGYDFGSTRSFQQTYKPYDTTDLFQGSSSGLAGSDITNRLASTFQSLGATFKDKGKNKSPVTLPQTPPVVPGDGSPGKPSKGFHGYGHIPETASSAVDIRDTLPNPAERTNSSDSSGSASSSRSNSSQESGGHGLWGNNTPSSSTTATATAATAPTHNAFAAASPSLQPTSTAPGTSGSYGGLFSSTSTSTAAATTSPVSAAGHYSGFLLNGGNSSSGSGSSGYFGGSINGSNTSPTARMSPPPPASGPPAFGYHNTSPSAAASMTGIKSTSHVRQSNGKGIFSVLPTNKSILPAPPAPKSIPDGGGGEDGGGDPSKGLGPVKDVFHDGVSFDSFAAANDDDDYDDDGTIDNSRETAGEYDDDVSESPKRSGVVLRSESDDEEDADKSFSKRSTESVATAAAGETADKARVLHDSSASDGAEEEPAAVAGAPTDEGEQDADDSGDVDSLEIPVAGSGSSTVGAAPPLQQQQQPAALADLYTEDDATLGYSGWQNVRSPSKSLSDEDK